MPGADKQKAVDYEALWPYPPESDGWTRAHNAIRADLTAIASMLNNFRTQLEAGCGLTPPQAAAARSFVGGFVRFLHHHHQSEEDIAFPYILKRCELPPKMSADHKIMEVLMKGLEDTLAQMLDAPTPDAQLKAVPAVQDVHSRLQELCHQHFKEEEEDTLMLMRKNFKPAEFQKNVVSKIVRRSTAEGTGIFFRTLTKDERRAFARQERIPFFIRWLLFSQVKKYERRVWAPFEQHCLTPAC